jgi:predicted protein tyrosine phosphatase
MPLKTVLFCAHEVAEERAPWVGWTMISITSPSSNLANLKSGWEKVLRLEFDDIECEEDPFHLFTPAHARAIIEFAALCNQAGVEGIVVHCRAGISLSAAVARWIADVYDLPFPAQYQRHNKHVYATLREEHILTCD